MKPKNLVGSRVAWEASRGCIASGLCVLHKCDTPSCINPEHLFLGTIADNHKDMDRKGRRVNHRGGPNNPPRGEAHPMAILSSRQVDEIRGLIKAGMMQKKIAHQFGISKSMVSRIKLGRSWVQTRIARKPRAGLPAKEATP
jgi:hypothetical protein